MFGTTAVFTDGRYPAHRVTLAETLAANWGEPALLGLMRGDRRHDIPHGEAASAKLASGRVGGGGAVHATFRQRLIGGGSQPLPPAHSAKTDIWLPFLNTYRTMCLAPEPSLRRILEEVAAVRRTA